MHAANDRLEFSPPQAAGTFRALCLALLAHAFLLAALTAGVSWKHDPVTITAEAELWSALPQEAAPQQIEIPPEVAQPMELPPPAPVVVLPPAPMPVQPLPQEVDIALEQEKLRLKKEKQREVEKAKELDKQRLEKRRQDKLKQEQAAKAADLKKKSDLENERKSKLAALQEAKAIQTQREANLKRIAGLAGATGEPTSKGADPQSTGPSNSYAGRIRARIKPNIVFTEDIVGNPEAAVEVRTSPDGTILSRALKKSSGNKFWDEAVLRAIDKTETLPRDTDGRVISPLTIVFRPRD